MSNTSYINRFVITESHSLVAVGLLIAIQSFLFQENVQTVDLGILYSMKLAIWFLLIIFLGELTWELIKNGYESSVGKTKDWIPASILLVPFGFLLLSSVGVLVELSECIKCPPSVYVPDVYFLAFIAPVIFVFIKILRFVKKIGRY